MSRANVGRKIELDILTAFVLLSLHIFKALLSSTMWVSPLWADSLYPLDLSRNFFAPRGTGSTLMFCRSLARRLGTSSVVLRHKRNKFCPNLARFYRKSALFTPASAHNPAELWPQNGLSADFNVVICCFLQSAPNCLYRTLWFRTKFHDSPASSWS